MKDPSYHFGNFSRRMALLPAPACIVMVMIVMPCRPCQAQLPGPVNTPPDGAAPRPGVKTYDVQAGQLNPSALPPALPKVEARSLTAAGLPMRTQAEIRKMVKEMQSGYRSVCCPFQEMKDITCPCHYQHLYMLEFLVSMGYEREQTDGFMRRGGPPELTDEYKSFLRRRGVRDGGQMESYLTVVMNQNGKAVEVGGWNKGWSDKIQQTPRGPMIYAVLGFALLLLVGTFVYAIRLILRPGKEIRPAETPAASSDASSVDADLSALNKRIETEAHSLDND